MTEKRDISVFIERIRGYKGKRMEIITGRNAFIAEKAKHAKMLEYDGMYLILKNRPIETMKHRYSEALFIPARVLDKQFVTQDPAKVKTSFYVGADELRLSFNQQLYPLYAMTPCVIAVVPFQDTRKKYRILRDTYEELRNNDGMFIFAYTLGEKPGVVVDVQVVMAASLDDQFKDPNQKSITQYFELNPETMHLIETQGLSNLLKTKTVPANQQVLNTLPVSGNWIVDQYLAIGMPIKLVFPEGLHELVVECTITKKGRKIIKE